MRRLRFLVMGLFYLILAKPSYAVPFDCDRFGFFCRFSNVGVLISTLIPNILLFAGFILLVYIVVAGFKMMQNAGSSEDTGNSKQAITAAIIGFAIIFTSYFIIQLIQFLTGVDIFNPDLPV